MRLQSKKFCIDVYKIDLKPNYTVSQKRSRLSRIFFCHVLYKTPSIVMKFSQRCPEYQEQHSSNFVHWSALDAKHRPNSVSGSLMTG